ncbi:MAG: ribonuclease HI [Holosporales bacterium]|jgi:ribonuclease HI|nr:ribonuclease HI [Holosporales bacterium]
MRLVDRQEFDATIVAAREIQVFTDGACSGNPGPGGWGALLRQDGIGTELSGGELATTNNRMELTAAISALNATPKNAVTLITTDSQYLKNGIESWIATWIRNSWKTSTGQSVKNQDLWTALYAYCQERRVTWAWVKGHSGSPENERVDTLAKQALARTMLAARRYTHPI